MSQYQTMSGSRVLAAYLGDIRLELVKMARTPQFAIPTMMFPIMFYLLFGVLLGSARGNGQAALYSFSSFGVLAAMGPGLFGFGVSLAFEREQGLLVYRQAIPMPAGSNLLARMVMAMFFTAIVNLALFALAIFVSHVKLGFVQGVLVFVTNVLGSLPFCALGMFVGSMVSGQAAPAILNIIFIPMSFLAGLFVPLEMMGALQKAAPVWPAYHLVQLVRGAIGVPSLGEAGTHVAALAGFTVLFFSLALRKLSGQGFQVFGTPRAGAGFALRRALNIGVLAVGIALVIVGVMGSNAPRAAASNAATSEDASDSGNAPPGQDASGSAVPAGVAAPDSALIANFDNGSADAGYGLGFTASSDQVTGGSSTATQKVVDGVLEVSGDVGTGTQFPFAGTSFIPAGVPGVEWPRQRMMDYSHKQALTFRIRGDARKYMVMMLGPRVDTYPAMYDFVAGPEWQQVRVPLSELAAVDLAHVKLIGFYTSAPGAFRFEIDDVRME